MIGAFLVVAIIIITTCIGKETTTDGHEFTFKNLYIGIPALFHCILVLSYSLGQFIEHLCFNIISANKGVYSYMKEPIFLVTNKN